MAAWFIERSKERSTWYALATLAGVLGFNITPEYIGEILSGLLGLAALIEGVKEES